jgi:hypothetical protein
MKANSKKSFESTIRLLRKTGIFPDDVGRLSSQKRKLRQLLLRYVGPSSPQGPAVNAEAQKMELASLQQRNYVQSNFDKRDSLRREKAYMSVRFPVRSDSRHRRTVITYVQRYQPASGRFTRVSLRPAY